MNYAFILTGKTKYKKFNDKYTYLDDGNASERVIRVVFKDAFSKK